MEIAKNLFNRKVAISKIFFEKTTIAKCLTFMVVLKKHFKLFNVINFQNLSNLPYWVLKMPKNVGFSKSAQNYCWYKGKIGKI